MNRVVTVIAGTAVAAALTFGVTACGTDDDESQSDDQNGLTWATADVGGTPISEEPLDVPSIKDSVRTEGNNLVVSAGWFDCHQETPMTCTGEQPVGPKDNDAFDDLYEQYSSTCQEKISLSNFRLDMAQRVRPWIVDPKADQVIGAVDEQNRTATATIKQTDGSAVVLHFEITNGQAVPQCNSDGTLAIERQ